jgi:hypothetical protein
MADYEALLKEKKDGIETKVDKGFADLKDMADGDIATMQKYAGFADDFAAKMVKYKSIKTEINKSDSSELRVIKQAMISAESTRLASVKATSETIRAVTSAAASVSSAIYPPAGAAIMLIGTLVDMAYNFYSMRPGPDWTQIVQSNWNDYSYLGLPYPAFAQGFDNIGGYAQDKLQRAVGFGGVQYMEPDAYANQPEPGRSWAWNTGKGGGYIGTSRPDVYRAIQQHAQAVRMTGPSTLPGVVEPLYQASPLLTFDFQAFGSAKVIGASGGTGVPVWYWWLDNNLALCSDRPTPLWASEYADMQAADYAGYTGEVIPPNPQGVPYLRLREGQRMMDIMIRQVCITCAMSQNVPVWAAQPVIDAGKRAWGEYRKSLLPLYAKGDESEIRKLTGETEEGNLVGKLARGSAKAGKVVPRGINGIDAMGYVMGAAMNKAQEIASTGLGLNNAPLFRPAWVDFAKKYDFQRLGAAEAAMAKGQLELSDAAKAKLRAAGKLGAKEAFILPGDKVVLLKDMPQFVRNGLKRDMAPPTAGWSTATKVALGLGGAAVLGGGGYYLYAQRSR